jgi:ABC-type Co2+ transport system permease subunit
MHIEPGVVDGAKILLSVATSAIACGLTIKACLETRKSSGTAALVQRSVIATFLVFCFFEVFWHHPVGISEVHLIMGSSLFLLFGAGPTAIGLTLGLLIQGLLFAPTDLPQFGMNLTSLLLPLFALNYVARRVISTRTAYVDLSPQQVLKLSATFQGGVVAWVIFWTIYGQGISVPTMLSILSFGSAYIGVIVLESCFDLCLLAGAKRIRQIQDIRFLDSRLVSASHRFG